MKINTSYVLITICLIFIFSTLCLSEEIIKTEENKTIKAPSTISPKNVNIKKSENIGKIKVVKDNVYYIINWQSKSRKTLKVVGDLKDEIKKLDGKIIEAKGIITRKSTWSGIIEIQSYKIKE